MNVPAIPVEMVYTRFQAVIEDYWLWGDGETILWGDGDEIQL